MKKIIVPVLAGLVLVSSAKAAEATTSLEALLPAEAAPDYATAKKHFKASASGQFWDSAEFKPFRKKLADGFEANVLAKIEEELAVDFDAFEEMASGPVALAVVPGTICRAGTVPGGVDRHRSTHVVVMARRCFIG